MDLSTTLHGGDVMKVTVKKSHKYLIWCASSLKLATEETDAIVTIDNLTTALFTRVRYSDLYT